MTINIDVIRTVSWNFGLVDDDDENTIQDVHEADRDFSIQRLFLGGKHPFFKPENTLFIQTETPFLTLLPKFFFSRGRKLNLSLWTEASTPVDRVLVLPVVGFEHRHGTQCSIYWDNQPCQCWPQKTVLSIQSNTLLWGNLYRLVFLQFDCLKSGLIT